MVRNNIVDFEGMMEEVQKYIKREENIELIRKAYECARVNHIGQFRKSGRLYCTSTSSRIYFSNASYWSQNNLCWIIT